MYMFLEKSNDRIIIRDVDQWTVVLKHENGREVSIRPECVEKELEDLFKKGYVDVTNQHYACFEKEGEARITLLDASDFSRKFLIKREVGADSSADREYWDETYNGYLSDGYHNVFETIEVINSDENATAEEDEVEFPTLDSIPRVPYSSVDIADRILNKKGFLEPFVWNNKNDR